MVDLARVVVICSLFGLGFLFVVGLKDGGGSADPAFGVLCSLFVFGLERLHERAYISRGPRRGETYIRLPAYNTKIHCHSVDVAIPSLQHAMSRKHLSILPVVDGWI